ncbi:MAG: hypothetical protein WCP46_00585 [Alphaproteobacteria bacterium]
MATSKKVFIEMELEWAEEQLQSWRAYVDANPLHELKDRVEMKPTARGGMMPMVIASIEQQGKFIQDTMKNYLSLLKEVDLMREKEETKKEARGNSTIPHRMQS